MDYSQNNKIARQTAQMQNMSSVMPLGGGAFTEGVSVASSRPGTTSAFRVSAGAGHTGGVRKVQSSAFGVSAKQARPSEPKLQAEKFVGGNRLNESSGQLHHVPKGLGSNQGERRKQSFKLSSEAYKKLTTNYNYGGGGKSRQSGIGQDQANRKLQVFATQDLKFTQQKNFDEISQQMAPAAIQLRNNEPLRPATGPGLSTAISSNSGQQRRTTQSVKRGSRTIQHNYTLDSSINAEPRFSMYNKEAIKSQLDNRRVRRAQSNIRPRQRFSTITAFHKNDIHAVNYLQEEGFASAKGNTRTGDAQAAQWSANTNLNLERSGKKAASFPIKGFNSGPAYSIPAQHYPGRVSPDKTDRTPRTPVAGNGPASMGSPTRERGSITQRTISPNPTSEMGDITPGCTDYTPRVENVLKQEPGYAPQRAIRWREQSQKEGLSVRPHVYEDPNQRTFRRSNSGSFARAKRFNTPIDGTQVRAYLLQLQTLKSVGGRQKSMGNLGEFSSKNNKQFYMTSGSNMNVNQFNTSSGTQVQQEVSQKKARPQTETGRMRVRRNTTVEVVSTADVTGESPDYSNVSVTPKKRVMANSMHTPRFSQTARTNSQIGLERSTIVSTPGPACYHTGVESCIKTPEKQITFTTAPRFVERKPSVNPDAPFYDTRPALYLLHKKQPRIRIAEAKREISPHLFHAKNSRAFQKGVFLKP